MDTTHSRESKRRNPSDLAAKVRARNYAASLRLEGIKPGTTDTAANKESLLNKYRANLTR